MVVVSQSERASAKKVVRLLRLAANPVRLIIIRRLSSRSAHVGETASALRMSHSAVSHQLALLARSGIVESKKEGRAVRYRLARNNEARRLSKALRALGA